MQLLRRLLGARTTDPPESGKVAPVAAPADPTEVVATSERHVASGRLPAALAALDAALSVRPDDAQLQLARVATLLAWGRYHEARAGLALLPELSQQRPEYCAKLAGAMLHLGNLKDAEVWMRKAMAGDPSSGAYGAGLAAVLHRQDRLDEAAAAYGRILVQQPDDFDAAMGLGSCELDRRNPAAAERSFRRAVAIDGERAVAWMFLGVALDRQDRGTEGLAAHQRAAQLEQAQDEDVDAYLGLAGSLRDAGRFADALALLEPNLQRRQGAEAQMLRAQMLLALGRLPEGWQQNESRWMTGFFLARRAPYRLATPVWDGQDLTGRTILLRAEQGMGDTIQFVRYAPLVKALGATVILAVPPELMQLAQGMHGVDRVVDLSREDALPAFDYYISLLSLPRVFGTDLATVPAAVPYLDVGPGRAQRWAARFATEQRVFKVGLVWGGNPVNLEDRYRSLPLAMLAPLGRVSGVRFYSLQKGARERDARTPPPGLDLVDLGPELADFADTAAAIGQMDLVISVCTSVAHLAGALGKPLWVPLHRAADWRWLTERTDSPWYPTARLFRQTRRGDWADVVDRIMAALEDRVRTGAPPSTIPAPIVRALPNVTKPAEAPGFRPGHSAVAQVRAGTLEFFPGDDGVGDSVGWYGEWLQPQLDLLAELIRPGSTLLEAGAGVGAHAALLARILGDGGHLFVYEWRDRLPRLLRQNLAANDVAAVTIMRRRLGPGAVTADGNPRVAADATSGAPASESLDELRLARLDWLKVADGIAASEVLAGAADTLWRLRPALFLAAADAAEIDRLAGVAKVHGYRCWRHECALFNAANFNRRGNDIFAGRTALSLLAFPEEVEVDVPPTGCVALP